MKKHQTMRVAWPIKCHFYIVHKHMVKRAKHRHVALLHHIYQHSHLHTPTSYTHRPVHRQIIPPRNKSMTTCVHCSFYIIQIHYIHMEELEDHGILVWVAYGCIVCGVQLLLSCVHWTREREKECIVARNKRAILAMIFQMEKNGMDLQKNANIYIDEIYATRMEIRRTIKYIGN